MLQVSDALLFHDDLAEISTPFYLHEFVGHAAGHGLCFLAEADLAESMMRDAPESAGRLMAGLPDDAVVREQYLDFFKNRMFRQTLLCRAEATVRRALDDGALERLWLSSPARAAGEGPDGETFATPDGHTMTTFEPHVRAAMRALGEAWPAAVAFPQLVDRACEAVDPGVPEERLAARLRDVLLQAHLARMVALLGCAPPVPAGATGPGERPCASPLARAQLAAGAPILSSLVQANVALDEPLDLALLPLLDGTRDRAALRAAAPGDPSDDDVDAALARLGSLGLLRA